MEGWVLCVPLYEPISSAVRRSRGKVAELTALNIALLVVLVSRIVGVIPAVHGALSRVRAVLGLVRLPVARGLRFPRLLLLLVSTAVVALLLVVWLLLLLMMAMLLLPLLSWIRHLE